MKLPSKEAQKAAVHAYIYDTEKDYIEYMEKKDEDWSLGYNNASNRYV